MNNLRAFYAKIEETKNQIKLEFTLDSIAIVGNEIENIVSFIEDDERAKISARYYSLFIGQCLVEELNAEWVINEDITKSLVNFNNSIYINPYEIVFNYIVGNDKALNLCYFKETLLDLLNIEETKA
jgi:hypothetical protein